MPQMPPEWFLTMQELQRRNELDEEIQKRRKRHSELIEKIQMPGGLDDGERLELRRIIVEHNAFFEELRSLLSKNPLLPENLLKSYESNRD